MKSSKRILTLSIILLICLLLQSAQAVLMTIGAGERPVVWVEEVLASRNRRDAGVTAHPYGLYLVNVEYPEEFALPERYLGPHFLSGLQDVRRR